MFRAEARRKRCAGPLACGGNGMIRQVQPTMRPVQACSRLPDAVHRQPTGLFFTRKLASWPAIWGASVKNRSGALVRDKSRLATERSWAEGSGSTSANAVSPSHRRARRQPCRGRHKIRPPGRHGSGASNADPGMIRWAARLCLRGIFGSPWPQPTAASGASISAAPWPDFAPPCTGGGGEEGVIGNRFSGLVVV